MNPFTVFGYVVSHDRGPGDGLHDFPDQIPLLREADYEREGGGLGVVHLRGDAFRIEVVNLKGANAQAKEAIDGAFVVRGDDAYLREVSQKGGSYCGGLHCCQIGRSLVKPLDVNDPSSNPL